MEKPFKKILEDLMELEKIDARTKVFKKKSRAIIAEIKKESREITDFIDETVYLAEKHYGFKRETTYTSAFFYERLKKISDVLVGYEKSKILEILFKNNENNEFSEILKVFMSQIKRKEESWIVLFDEVRILVEKYSHRERPAS